MVQPKLMTFEELDALDEPEPLARIAYGSDPLQFGDLRLPEGDGPHPVVVVVHGGCWRAQYEIDHIGAFSGALTRDGVATWTLEYRRVGNPGGGWPGTFQDVGAGVDHLRRLAERYPLDLGRVVATGHSAGGHLALWLAARAKLAESEIRGADPLPLAGVVSLAGVDDLRRANAEGVCGDMAAQLLGGTADGVPERYRAASPKELLPLGVPTRLVNGVQDPVVPVAFGRDFAEAAKRAGDDAEIIEIPEAGHFELVAPAADAYEAVRNAVVGLTRR